MQGEAERKGVWIEARSGLGAWLDKSCTGCTPSRGSVRRLLSLGLESRWIGNLVWKEWFGGLAWQELRWITPFRGNVQRLLIAHGQVWIWRARAAWGTCPVAVMPVIYITDMGNGTGDGRAVEKAMSLGVGLGFQAFDFQRYPISVFSIWS